MLNPLRIFASPRIEVEWDDVVKRNLEPIYRSQNNAVIPIRLFDLLKGLGSVQSKRLKPSLMKSMLDYDYLFDLIDYTPDLKLRIADIKKHSGSELLTTVSGDMGIGLSVVVTSLLFDVDKSTVCKIIATGRRPDWKCLLKDGRVMLVEAKGSISQTTSKSQMAKAVDQKKHFPGDVRIATAALLSETVSSKLQIVDPPAAENGDGKNMRHVYRANHYASLFSFLGEEVMSLYFERIAKRLLDATGKPEMEDKQVIDNKLLNNAPCLSYEGTDYSGHLYLTGVNRYIFFGVDRRLLSYRGFLDYEDVEEQMREYKGNEYVAYSDGILVVNVKNSDTFFEENHIKSIGLSYEHIALSDIDSIRGSSFKRYVKYLLERCGGGVEVTDNGSLLLQDGALQKIFIIYHVRKVGNRRATWRQIEKAEELMQGREGVLVTNLWMPKKELNYSCIDREDFQTIADSRGDVGMLREVLLKN